ncbi:MAG: universal stress protein [Rubrivivax sp.]|nr:universal stress protein [Rubrivivax sp.]
MAYDRILIVVDADPSVQFALDEGVALAHAHDAEVVLYAVLPTYVMPATEMPAVSLPSSEEFDRQARINAEQLLATAGQVAERAGVRWRKAMSAGPDDAHCISQAAADLQCDLIVVASTGSNAVMRLLTGSVIPGLITHSRVPVLVCRQCSRGARIEHLAGTDHRARRRPAEAAPAEDSSPTAPSP